MLRVDWSAGIEFGMFSSLMACLPTAGSARVGADWGKSDGGRAIAPYTHQDLNGTSNGSYTPQYDLDVWYHNVLEYDPETQTINLTVYVRGESIPFMVITLANVPIITSDIYYLGSARYPVGNPPYDAGLSLSAIAEARIDNVVLSVEDPFCKSDSNYDGKVNLSDLVMIKSEFNRSDCQSDGPAPVERTWQTTSYANYDDGCYQKGVAYPTPRFTDNGNDTVTDKLTGLIWLKNANCFGARTWDQAIADCSGLASGSCGLTDGSSAGDWRLPNRSELNSLIDVNYFGPALSNASGTGQWTEGNTFTNVQSSLYYSSNTCQQPGNSDQAWTVGMHDGYINCDYGFTKANSCFVWPVRGGH